MISEVVWKISSIADFSSMKLFMVAICRRRWVVIIIFILYTVNIMEGLYMVDENGDTWPPFDWLNGMKDSSLFIAEF